MEITCAPLYAAYSRFWSRDDLNSLVVSFLVLMHQIVRASVPLMEKARQVAAKNANNDAVSRGLERYLTHHIKEERDHDHWLLDDLEAAGIDRRDVLGDVPGSMVASLVGAQYYWICHHDPVALLGYIRLLEGNPPSEEHIEQLQERTELPNSIFRTYRLHGELDPDHLREFDEMLDALPLSSDQISLIGLSATHTAHSLDKCLAEIEGEAGSEFRPALSDKSLHAVPHDVEGNHVPRNRQ